MEFISRVSAHAGRNRELCLISAHERLPGTLRYVHMHIASEAKDFRYTYMYTVSVPVYVCIYLHVP